MDGLSQALLNNKLLTSEQLCAARKKAKLQNQSLIHTLTKNYLNSKAIAKACASFYGLLQVNLNDYDTASLPLNSINLNTIKKYGTLPLTKSGQKLEVAISDPSHLSHIEEIKFQTGLEIQPLIADHNQLTSLMNNIISEQQYNAINNLSLYDTKNISKESNVVDFIDQVITDAMHRDASDIHFEPLSKNYRIRMRIDGLLYLITTVMNSLADTIISRIKVMAELDIAEKRLPQDGRFSFTAENNLRRECRVSSCPTQFGEKIVLRLLDPNKKLLSIDELGFTKPQKDIFLHHVKKPQGLILVTGPTGSGKTVTLYAALNLLNQLTHNICTIEDPIEMSLPGMIQVNINNKAGLSYAKTLRAFLRQDPDIIMVGEIRDRETADLAIRAAQTGHLVISTIHTNSAAQTITRLLNMGIAPFNIANSIILIIAQRLIRKLCSDCKKPTKLPRDSLLQMGFSHNESNQINLFKAHGCRECTMGYKNRTGIYEILPLSKKCQDIILKNGSAEKIMQKAQREGMQSIWQSAMHKVRDGITSLDEIYRIVESYEREIK